MDQQLVCARCGTVTAATAALTWTRSLEGKAVQWHCPACSREHVRSIEAKLDEQYW